jgi:SAM-dependent methyltransferase
MQTLATLAAEHGALTQRELSSVIDTIARLRPSLPSLSLTDQTRAAIDLQAIHARLTGGRDVLAPSPERPHVALSVQLASMLDALAALSARHFAADRARIEAGGLRGRELITWLAEYPPEQRDMAMEQLLGIVHRPLGKPELHPELVGYIPSGIAPIVQAVRLIPVGAEDSFVDVGSGLGKVAMAVHLLSGAEVRGIELQPELVDAARERARALGLDAISYELADARVADFSGASVVFLYLPFTGGTLDAAMRRIEAAAQQRQLVVCTLGLDLGAYGWLRERATDELWLSIYDSCAPQAAPRPSRSRVPLGAAAAAVATERSPSREELD